MTTYRVDAQGQRWSAKRQAKKRMMRQAGMSARQWKRFRKRMRREARA